MPNIFSHSPHPSSPQNERFEESVERAAKEGADLGSTMSTIEKAGNLSIMEENAIRSRLEEMEEAEEKEQANDRAIEDKIKVLIGATGDRIEEKLSMEA